MIQDFNRVLIEQELLSHIIDNTVNQQLDQEWKNKIIYYLISIVTNEEIPENLKLDTLIKHNIVYPNNLLEKYLKSLPEMTEDVLQGTMPPNMITQQHHGYMSMMMMSYDSSNIKITNNLSTVKQNQYEFTLELDVKQNRILIHVLNKKHIIKLQNFKYIKPYINNYEDLKDIQDVHLKELLEQLMI